MSFEADTVPISTPRYARFSRRLRAMLLDWILTLVVMFGAVLLATLTASDGFSRALGIVVVVALLLYEPVLVSFAGGTLGHYFTNLRVVDRHDGGNISFAKACARFVIKGVLGLYSFVVLAATRRNQAVHDLLTRSTVQIRDPAKALPGQYITERAEPADVNMPPPLRRIALILAYLLLLLIAGAIVSAVTLSAKCIDNNFCSAGERVVSLVTAMALLALTALIIVQGWKGRLFGARKAA